MSKLDVDVPHPIKPYPKLIINAALTGMVHTKADNPNIPLTVDEIVKDAILCCRAGASILHIHARDKKGFPSSDKQIYAEIIAGIRNQCPDVIICVSTSGRYENSFKKRSEVLDLEGTLKPDMASLTLGSLNFLQQPSINSHDMIENLALKMKEKSIIPELEIFDAGMINAAKMLIKKDILCRPFCCNLLLGSIYSAPATLFDLSWMVKSLPADFYWAAAGIGRFQLNMNIAAVLMGAGVRLGLEDNIYYDTNKKTFASNLMLVERIVRIANEIGRDIATPQQARQILGFPKTGTTASVKLGDTGLEPVASCV